MFIRLATLSDLAAITDCAHRAYAKYVERIGRKPAPMIADFEASLRAKHVHVIQQLDRIIGYVVHYPLGDSMHLENVAVLPESRGRGAGRRLINFVEQETARQKLRAVELYTNVKMTENLLLYPAIGYVETGRRTEDGFERVYFKKSIK